MNGAGKVVARSGIREKYGLRPIINVSGTMTALGASIVVPEAVDAIAKLLPEFVEIGDLQKKASRTIARLCDTEAGVVTASASAGITIAVAAAMTGDNLAAIERLPDTTGLKNEVPIQVGHMVGYGAPVEQAIRIAGAKPIPVGQATHVARYQLEGAINERTAAVLYVVSHHTVQFGQLSLEEVAEVAHARGVPVIVDAASEYELQGFLKRGGDIAIWSAHKFLGGATAGIIAGSKPLMRACFLQNMGVGRGMKVGKEGMIGTIACLEAWEKRDHAAVRARETSYLEHWRDRFADRPGLKVEILPDPTHNPLDRMLLTVDPAEARITAWDLADALARGNPPVIVRDHEVELGHFFLDPCNLHPGEAEIVADRVIEELEVARRSNETIATPVADRARRRYAGLMRWPD